MPVTVRVGRLGAVAIYNCKLQLRLLMKVTTLMHYIPLVPPWHPIIQCCRCNLLWLQSV